MGNINLNEYKYLFDENDYTISDEKDNYVENKNIYNENLNSIFSFYNNNDQTRLYSLAPSVLARISEIKKKNFLDDSDQNREDYSLSYKNNNDFNNNYNSYNIIPDSTYDSKSINFPYLPSSCSEVSSNYTSFSINETESESETLSNYFPNFSYESQAEMCCSSDINNEYVNYYDTGVNPSEFFSNNNLKEMNYNKTNRIIEDPTAKSLDLVPELINFDLPILDSSCASSVVSSFSPTTSSISGPFSPRTSSFSASSYYPYALETDRLDLNCDLNNINISLNDVNHNYNTCDDGHNYSNINNNFINNNTESYNYNNNNYNIDDSDNDNNNNNNNNSYNYNYNIDTNNVEFNETTQMPLNNFECSNKTNILSFPTPPSPVATVLKDAILIRAEQESDIDEELCPFSIPINNNEHHIINTININNNSIENDTSNFSESINEIESIEEKEEIKSPKLYKPATRNQKCLCKLNRKNKNPKTFDKPYVNEDNDDSDEKQCNKPYACEYSGCKWAFSRISDKNRHLRSHYKPLYHCPFWKNDQTCHRNGGAFNRLDVQKRHLKLMHFQENQNKSGKGHCRECGKEFADVKTFIRHCENCASNIVKGKKSPCKMLNNNSSMCTSTSTITPTLTTKTKIKNKTRTANKTKNKSISKQKD